MMQNLPRFRVVKDKITGLYKCHLCSYKSVYGSSLRSHFAVHSNARPYGCDMCSYEAKRLPDLKKHKILKHIRKSHSGSNLLSNKSPLQVFRDPSTGLYRCQHCSYQSDNARCVRSHLAVHSHVRPYACDMCSYEAKRSSDLSKHKIIKHGRVPCRRNKPRTQTNPRNDSSSACTNDQSAMLSNVATVSSTSGIIKQGDGPELDHCDVLSDLDYSLMSPTRAALEALRRCNMEPLDMFNEYSGSQDGFQQNPVFPEPETDYNRRTYQDMNMSAGNRIEEPRGNYVTNVPGANMQDHQRLSTEDTVFIKPEPPDDYFDHMSCQVQTQPLGQSNSKWKVTVNDVPKDKPSSSSRSSEGMDSPRSAGNREMTSGIQDFFGEKSNNGSCNDRGPRMNECNGDEQFDQQEKTEKVLVTLQKKEPEQVSTERNARDMDKAIVLLERKNLSGFSLIRPPMAHPVQRSPDAERSSAEYSQSRESGYSSPAASLTPLSQTLSNPMELTDQAAASAGTNTRKSWSCPHCDIMFFDGAMFFMHMGLHNTEDPWRCNMCHTKFNDVYGFTSHFVNGHL